ncbi:MAG: SpoIIE family protein phosphatase [Candidatus Kapabacteria bacterium]|jgi:sigma-B regulation protein RsbU (phosphoserine phosphatase)|nr:SpoIIE family protein phosphatase [Candidatus Kapabacteria bacterium]
MKILIADDSEDMQLLLRQFVRKWGHEVVIAEDGEKALQILETSDIQLVISDWAMPNMTGIELCRAVRERFANERYIYIILLTARQDQEDLVTGMEAGADDFVRKPFNKDELRVRLRAGERTLQMQQTLAEQNKRLEAAQDELRKDLEAASAVQRSLLPNPEKQPFLDAGYRFDWLYVPAAYLGGDTCNFLRLDAKHIGFYMVDVAGHGIPSALKTVMLSQTLSAANGQAGLLKDDISYAPHCYIRPPSEALYELNNASQNEFDAMHYFTMIYGVIDVSTGRTTLSQAGHPAAIVLRRGGTMETIDAGGVPIGMLEGMMYDESEFTLETAERLVLYTDGIIECENADGAQFTFERLQTLLQENVAKPLQDLIQAVHTALVEWRGSAVFDDDVSLLVIERF